MEEKEIIRLNIERFRRLLQTVLDERARWVIQAMLAEYELKLVLRSRQSQPKPPTSRDRDEEFRRRLLPRTPG